MPMPVIPTKTALGQEELRRRTGGLGQRHRTILFLIDGRRPLSEVLSLAQKAGAATTHFEDLVRLGYVEMPPEEVVPAEPALAAEAAQLTHVDYNVPADAGDALEALEPIGPIEPPARPIETVVLVPSTNEPPLTTPAIPREPTPPDPAEAPPPVAASRPAPSQAPASAAPAAPPEAAPAPAPAPPPRAPERSAVAQAVAEFVAVDDNEPFSKVRRCLLEALHMDPTPFGFRAAMRVRTARTTAALVDLVWEMERDMSHSHRSRAGLQSLQRARELLGLGNTLVDEDSQAGRLDDDE